MNEFVINIPVPDPVREGIDPRTRVPLDRDTLIESVSRTGRAVIIDEGCQSFGVTAELASVVYDGAFDFLDAPILRLGAMDVPVPFSKPLEDVTIPNEQSVIKAVKSIA